MKTADLLSRIRTYNPWSLFGGLGLILAGILLVSVYDRTAWWNLLPVLLGTLALGLFLAANLAEMKRTGRKRSTQVKAGLVMVAVAMLGILAAVNYIGARHPIRFDLTSNKFYSLSEQTLDTLGKLKEDVNVTMLITKRKNTLPEVGRAESLLWEYAKKSPKFKFRVVNIDKSPSESKRYNVRELNVVVFESGTNRKDVLQRDYVTYAFEGRRPTPKFQGEAAFTAALVTMMDTAQKVIYLTDGHGERELGSPQPDGLSSLKDMLEKSNYAVKTVNLATDGKIPADASVLGVLGPQKTFHTTEIDMIRQWMKTGGKLFLCVDPRVPSGGFAPLLKDFGLRMEDCIILDTTSYAPPDLMAVVPKYRYLGFVEKLSDSRMFSIMPYTRAVTTTAPALENARTQILVETTSEGWGETNFTNKQPAFDAGTDLKGPVPMLCTSEWTPPEAPDLSCRLVVAGGSTWITNSMSQAPGNFDMAVNAFNWLAMQESKISIRPKEEEQRMMSLSNVGINFVRVLALIVLPFGVLAAGTVVWYRRRRL